MGLKKKFPFLGNRRWKIFWVSLFVFSGCVSLPNPPTSFRPSIKAPSRFEQLDSRHVSYQGLHFSISSYSQEKARRVSELAERLYQQIMQDTGLYSFLKPSHIYPIVVYDSVLEYLKKTGMPEWSSGVAAGDEIYVYENPELARVLAHEMSHLIFNEFFGLHAISQWRWLNEGLAMYEESKTLHLLEKAQIESGWKEKFKTERMSLEQMVRFMPFSEERRNVDLWYAQARSVVGFLIEREGSFNFSLFLSALRDLRDVNQALQRSYPGKVENLRALETAWLNSF